MKLKVNIVNGDPSLQVSNLTLAPSFHAVWFWLHIQR